MNNNPFYKIAAAQQSEDYIPIETSSFLNNKEKLVNEFCKDFSPKEIQRFHEKLDIYFNEFMYSSYSISEFVDSYIIERFVPEKKFKVITIKDNKRKLELMKSILHNEFYHFIPQFISQTYRNEKVQINVRSS